MPLLRLQQPCPRQRSTRTPGATRCWPTSRMRRALLPGRRLTSIFFGGGTPSLMEPATVAALIEAARRALAGRGRHRDHARGQPQFGRGGALRRPRRRRRQPPLARPAELRRREPAPSSAAPIGATRGWTRWTSPSATFAPRQLRPDLRAARRHRSDAWSATLDRALALGTGHLSLYQLTIEPGTRFAALAAAGELDAARYRRARRALRADPGAYRRRRHSRLRNQQPCPARRGEPPQSHLLALRRLCRRRPRRPRPPPRPAHGPPPQAREFPRRAHPQRPRHRRGRAADARRGGGRGAGHGPAAGRGHRRGALWRRASNCRRSSTGRRSTG